MIEIIPVSKRNDEQVDTNKKFYIEDSPELQTIAEKYNWAIENIVLKSDDYVICFRHADTEIRSNTDLVEAQVRMQMNNHCGVCGVIGTIALESSCQWWQPNRHVNGSGYIIQGGTRPKLDKDKKPVLDEAGHQVVEKIEYPMADHPGVHDYLATIDGCCFWLNRSLLDDGLRFDTNLKGYHFYDADICCQVLERGWKVSTINVVVKHESQGVMPPDFQKLRDVFFKKWNDKIDIWPITRLTRFK